MARLNIVKSFRGTTKTEDGCLTCGKCRTKICKGDSYKWWANMLPGGRGSFRNIRCMSAACHPRPSEMTPGRRGELYAIQENAEDALDTLGAFEVIDDLEVIAADAAEALRELAQDMIDSADNMEDGFGHATERSDELRERGDNLTNYADDVESVDLDDPPEREEYDDDEDGEEEYQTDIERWREDMKERVREIVNEADIDG